MMQGKMSQAMKFINNESDTKGVHEITNEIVNKLKEKHPNAQQIQEDTHLEEQL